MPADNVEGEKIYSGGPMAGSSSTGRRSRGVDPRGRWNRGTTSITGAYVTWPVRRFRLAKRVFPICGFMPAQGPQGEYPGFDFDRDTNAWGCPGPLGNANNPDLRKFAGAGGKLILYQVGGSVGHSIRCPRLYETAAKSWAGVRRRKSSPPVHDPRHESLLGAMARSPLTT